MPLGEPASTAIPSRASHPHPGCHEDGGDDEGGGQPLPREQSSNRGRRVDPGGDRAGGQSQRAFPSCRCNATACSVTVARSRSISARASSNAACSRDTPGRPGTAAANAPKGALPGHPARGNHRGPIHSVPLGGLPLSPLPGQHRHVDLVLLARRQTPPPDLPAHRCSGHPNRPPTVSGTPPPVWAFPGPSDRVKSDAEHGE